MASLADVQRFLRQKRATGQAISGEEQRRAYEAFFDVQASRNLERGRLSLQRKTAAENLALAQKRQALAERTSDANISAADRAFALRELESEENRAFRERQEKREAGAAKISGITEIGKLGFQALSSPLGQKAITKVGDFLKPSTTEVVSSIPSAAKPIGVQGVTTQAVSSLTPSVSTAAPGAVAGTGAGAFAAPTATATEGFVAGTGAGPFAAPATAATTTGTTALASIGTGLAGAGAGIAGKYIGEKVTGDKGFGTVAGGAAAGFVVGGPVGAIIGGILGVGQTILEDSWICTKTKELIGFTDKEWNTIGSFREYAKKNHGNWLKWYVGIGPELLEAINGDKPFYAELKEHMLSPVVKLTEYGAEEAAYLAYKQVVLDLADTYAPKLIETTPEGV